MTQNLNYSECLILNKSLKLICDGEPTDKEIAEKVKNLLQVCENTISNHVNEKKTVDMAFYLDVPAMFEGQCEVNQYNNMLRNEIYLHVLKRFFTQGIVPDSVIYIFEKIDLSYKMDESVINVLIHYLHVSHRSWTKSSIEAVAADFLGKGVATYEQAVKYVHDKAKYAEQIQDNANKKPNYSSKGSDIEKIQITENQKKFLEVLLKKNKCTLTCAIDEIDKESANQLIGWFKEGKEISKTLSSLIEKM